MNAQIEWIHYSSLSEEQLFRRRTPGNPFTKKKLLN